MHFVISKKNKPGSIISLESQNEPIKEHAFNDRPGGYQRWSSILFHQPPSLETINQIKLSLPRVPTTTNEMFT